MRKKRFWTEHHTAELLKSLETMRKVCRQVQDVAPINGDVYRATEKLAGAIDDVAGVLTGDRKHFWNKPI